MTSAPGTTSSVRTRIALAIALTAAFYLLALGIALGLIATPIVLYATQGSGNLFVAIALIGAGLAILRAIVPARARFDPPGPRLEREAHPELHALLDRIAAAAGEQPADRVYLDLDVNAAVLEHGGDRILLLGLGLLSQLDAEELEAVVAHEYGHYAGGDTRLSQWIWRTRVAVLRTVQTLAESEYWFRRNVVRWPFQGYAIAFLRITNAVSRRAEYAADAYAARATSAAAIGRALRSLSAVGPVFESFWTGDVVPVLLADRRPGVAVGFRAMTSHTELSSDLDALVAGELQARDPDPYASHPSLRERLAALGVAEEASAPAPVAEPASGLLRDLPGVEAELLAIALDTKVAAFAPIDWDEVAPIHLENRRELLEKHGGVFADVATIAEAGAAAATLEGRTGALRERLAAELDYDQVLEIPLAELEALAFETLVGLTLTALVRAGGRLTAPPGEPLLIHVADASLDVFSRLGTIAAGKEPPASWGEAAPVAALGAAPLHPATHAPAPETAGDPEGSPPHPE